MVANAKGGVGKTTVTTNLITHLSEQHSVGLIDLDPQHSASYWLQMRDEIKPTVTNYSPKSNEGANHTRSWMKHKVGREVRYLVCDTPAGLQSPDLDRLLVDADILLIPVAPSQIDIHATAGFVQQLLLNPQYRAKPVRLGVIMNRVKRNTLSFQKLTRFLSSLKIPVITALRDTQNYLKAVEEGRGINEMTKRYDSDIADWQRILAWINKAERQQAVAMERKQARETLAQGSEQLLSKNIPPAEAVKD
ncbi:ParA family protein [Halioxenophilus aromaticivorans]|uniref:ParA family protein n=2 Tax=Halioxenophilus aromaticivorans TaxID=1306992 RepID=A0AAV3U197_9ALTE